jgi:hypothetical protein
LCAFTNELGRADCGELRTGAQILALGEECTRDIRGKPLIRVNSVLKPGMACELQVARSVRMKTVQVAIQDPGYADSIRSLLVQDGVHQVHLVEKPDLTLDGVIVVDAANLDGFPLPPNRRERLIVVVKERDDLPRIWDAGVRHVVFLGDSPDTARVVVLGVELALGALWRDMRQFTQLDPNPTPWREDADKQKPNRQRPGSSLESTRRVRCRARRAPPKR